MQSRDERGQLPTQAQNRRSDLWRSAAVVSRRENSSEPSTGPKEGWRRESAQTTRNFYTPRSVPGAAIESARKRRAATFVGYLKYMFKYVFPVGFWYCINEDEDQDEVEHSLSAEAGLSRKFFRDDFWNKRELSRAFQGDADHELFFRNLGKRKHVATKLQWVRAMRLGTDSPTSPSDQIRSGPRASRDEASRSISIGAFAASSIP